MLLSASLKRSLKVGNPELVWWFYGTINGPGAFFMLIQPQQVAFLQPPCLKPPLMV